MGRFTESDDLYWTSEGDFFLGEENEFLSTKNFKYRTFIQRVKTRLESKKREWALQGEVGADISRHRGKQNTRELGQQIQDDITAELTRGSFLGRGEFSVKIIPVSAQQIAIFLVITPSDVSGQVRLVFTFDVRDNKVIPRNV